MLACMKVRGLQGGTGKDLGGGERGEGKRRRQKGGTTPNSSISTTIKSIVSRLDLLLCKYGDKYVEIQPELRTNLALVDPIAFVIFPQTQVQGGGPKVH